MPEMTWGNVSDDAVYVRQACDELGFTGDFADLDVYQMSQALMLAARLKPRTETVQTEELCLQNSQRSCMGRSKT